MTEPESPLSPSALAQVPEVRKALSALTGVNYTFCVDRLPPSEDALLLAVRDATLKAERDRLLALTPEAVVEAAHEEGYQAHKARYPSATRDDDMLLVYLRAAEPILLAPEVAKREQVERERDEARELLVTIRHKATEDASAIRVRAERERAESWELIDKMSAAKLAAEAEVARLRGALGKFGNAPCLGTDENNDTCGVTFTCGACRQNAEVRAALEVDR